ncbi:unnamed protein product, partial [marine sediment metagenome]
AAQTAKRFGRIKAAAKVAGLEAAVNAAIEIPLVAGNPTSTPQDVLWAAMFGGVIGGGIGGLAYKVKPHTAAKTMADQHAPVADDAMENLARAEAHEMAGENLEVKAPDEMRNIAEEDPIVRSRPAPESKADYDARKSLQGQQAKLEAELESVSGRKLPDEPVAPKAPGLLEGMVEELSFIKRVRDGEVKLSAADKSRADSQYGVAKREFLTEFRKADPDGYAEVYGTKRNPNTDDFEAGLPAAEKRMAGLTKKHEGKLAEFTRAIDE